MVLPSAPSNGAGMPHSMSRVTARGFKPSFIQFKLKFLTLVGRCWLFLRYSVRGSESFERSMYQCRVVFTVGLLLQMTQYGSTSSGWFQKFAADVALVAAGFLAAAVRTFAFYEAVRQETLVVFAVEHLGVLGEDVTVFLDFQKGFLDEFFVDWAFCAGVIVKGGIPLAEKLCDFGVVAVS